MDPTVYCADLGVILVFLIANELRQNTSFPEALISNFGVSGVVPCKPNICAILLLLAILLKAVTLPPDFWTLLLTLLTACAIASMCCQRQGL